MKRPVAFPHLMAGEIELREGIGMSLQPSSTAMEAVIATYTDPLVPAPGPATAFNPAPLIKETRNWTRWISPAISLAILAAVMLEIDGLGFRQLADMVPTSPLFWIVFLCYYFAGPTSEWIIYRRLWRIPASGFVALIRKLISNEILIGYLGEVYFYAWARQRGDIAHSPFGAIKDVTILSGMVGNGITLVLLAVLYPSFGSLELGSAAQTVYLSIGVILLSTFLVMLFRNRLFSLPLAELWMISFIHFIRIVVVTLSSALLWHLVLPDIAISWWLLLASARLFISRLPLLPNKDILFAGMAVFFIGYDAQITSLLTMMASIILVFHIGLGLILSVPDFIQKWRQY